jgi:hypothetical protein
MVRRLRFGHFRQVRISSSPNRCQRLARTRSASFLARRVSRAESGDEPDGRIEAGRLGGGEVGVVASRGDGSSQSRERFTVRDARGDM